MFARHLKISVFVFLSSASICSAIEEGVYSCKPELICNFTVDTHWVGSPTGVPEIEREPSQEDIEKLFKEKQITDRDIKSLIVGAALEVKLRDFFNCEAPTDLDINVEHGNPGLVKTLPRSAFNKKRNSTKIVFIGDEIKQVVDYKNRVGVKDLDEVDEKIVVNTYRVISREQKFVLGNFERGSGYSNQALTHHAFVRFSGDRLVYSWSFQHKQSSAMGQAFYFCEKL
jgi:hypothetical protein